MDQQEIYNAMSVEDFRHSFSSFRSKIDKAIEEMDFIKRQKFFIDLYTEIGVMAIEGDVVVQDYLGYIFKHGKEPYIDENIELAMKWLILAGANGNKGTIRKLTLFLGYAYDKIFEVEDFDAICKRNNITKQNYEFVIGKLICEAIVDSLKIDALALTKEKLTKLEYNEKTLRVFDKARNEAIPVVLNYLRS